jgi:hypothetical protein
MKKRTRNKARTEIFDLVINGQAIEVSATPYLINSMESRFRVSYNESAVYIFVQNPETHHVALAEGNLSMPVQVSQAIAARLEKIESRKAA